MKSLCALGRCMVEWKYTSTHESGLWVEISSQLHAPTVLTSREYSPVPVNPEELWAPVSERIEEEIYPSLLCTRIRTVISGKLTL